MITITLREIDSLKPIMNYACHNGVIIKAHVDRRDCEDLLSHICEEMGDEDFIKYVNKIIEKPEEPKENDMIATNKTECSKELIYDIEKMVERKY